MRRVYGVLVLAVLLAGTARAQEPEYHGLCAGVEVHITYDQYQGKPVPSNGLIVHTRDSIVLIDTGWGVRNTRKVLRHIKLASGRPVAACISTHFHDDRTGGIPVLQRGGVRCIGTAATRDLALQHRKPAPVVIVPEDTTFMIDGVAFAVFHPGAGHTRDNIVVWLPNAQILMGGCLVKSTESTDLGHIGDADLEAWPGTIRVVQARFPDARSVISGHGAWGGLELLDHTLHLLDQHGH